MPEVSRILPKIFYRTEVVVERSREPHACKSLDKLGSGSFGDVYIDESHDDMVVKTKLIKPGRRRKQKDTLAYEFVVMKRLREENEKRRMVGGVCDVFKYETGLVAKKDKAGHILELRRPKFYETSGERYEAFSLRRAKNGTLQDYYLSRRQTMTELELQRMAYYLVQTLKDMHGRGVIHRDIKPGNIVLSDGMLPVVLDFGLCSSNGRPKTRCGTPGYCAPEIFEKGAVEHDNTLDMWSFGVVLYEMITGHNPFWYRNIRGYVKNIKDYFKNPKLLTFPEGTSAECEAFIRSLLMPRDTRLSAVRAEEAAWIRSYRRLKRAQEAERLAKKKEAQVRLPDLV